MKQLFEFLRKSRNFVSKGLGHYYAYGSWRLNRWLDQKLIRTKPISHNDLFDYLDLEKFQSRQSINSIESEIDKGYVGAYFQNRKTPCFFFETADVEKNSVLIGNAQQKTINAANEVCNNTFCFRQVNPVTFEDDVDWLYRPQGNIDWTWDLNRHTYFETLGRAYSYTGNQKYAHKFCELLLDWLVKNPPSTGHQNWSSVFEVGFRINTWIWGFYYFRKSSVFDAQLCFALLKGLLEHGQYLDRYLELHAPNNHLLLEAKSLAMLGILFPELKPSKYWRRRGLEIFYKEFRAQVCSDGVHGERATHYHRVIAGEALELLVLLENNGIAIPPDIIELFGRMVEVELWLTKPNGLIPLLGDSALEDTYFRFSAAKGGVVFLNRSDLKAVAPPPGESEIWLLGPKRIAHYQETIAKKSELTSRAFPEGGYFVMRAGQPANKAAYLVFDCGPFGYTPLPSHGHADALSFEMYAHGQTFVVDPGIYSTQLGHRWRNFFRGSRAHNTVVVDHQDQSTLVDIWRVHRPAQAKLHQWITTDEFDFIDGSHDGYRRLLKPITHRRQIFFAKPEYWVVIDILIGQGQHDFDLYYHFVPKVQLYLDQQSKYAQVSLQNCNESGLLIAPLNPHTLQAEVMEGCEEPVQGWVSFLSGQKLAAPSLRYRQQTTVPAQFCTMLYPYSSKTAPSISISTFNIEAGNQQQYPDVFGVQINTENHIDYLMLDSSFEKRRKVFGNHETDAWLVYLRYKKDDHQVAKAIKYGGDKLLINGQPVERRSYSL